MRKIKGTTTTATTTKQSFNYVRQYEDLSSKFEAYVLNKFRNYDSLATAEETKKKKRKERKWMTDGNLNLPGRRRIKKKK